MGTEGRRRDKAEFRDGPEEVLACLEAAFEDGDPEAIAAALTNAARAKGLAQDPLTARSDIASVVGTVNALGLKLAVKAA
ncbi:MAG TPA: hypothetical protein VGB57_00080 [Allosphingosinicella sp.]|jgi:DNA-binding phage protein